MLIKPSGIIRRLMPDIVWNIEGSDCVYLTFDDGPTPGVTEWILAQLDKYDARATFFCLGKNAEMYPDLVQAIAEHGHKLGNHTYSHQKGWEMSLERYVEDVDFANQFLHTDLMRPPYGRITPAQMRALSERYRIVMANIISRDYNSHLSPRMCLRNVTRHIGNGSIIVFHDSVKAFKNMHFALPRTLSYMQQRGIRSEALELW